MNTAPKLPMSQQDIEHWIAVCNHEPARQVLRDYLRLALAPSSSEGVGRPSPNWCRTCGKHWRDPAAVFCSDSIHREVTTPQSAPVDGDAAGDDAHSDDAAVDRFAAVMKSKLAAKRAQGRGGWDDPTQASVELLSYLLHEHVAKGDPVDVGNLAMMLHQRGSWVLPTPTPPPASQERGGDDHVRKLVGKLDQWRACMSYNESYFGEPAGLVKSTVAELARAVDPIYPPKAEPVDPLAGVTIHTATVPLAASPPSSAAEASINSHEIDSKLIPDAAEQAKPERLESEAGGLESAEQAQAGEDEQK